MKFVFTSTTGVKTTFGRYTKMCSPGLHFYIPIIQHISVVSNMVEQDTFKLQVKTRDNAFATISVAVQHQITSENTATAFFSLTNPTEQINSYVENAIRGIIQTMTFDESYASTDTVCKEVSAKLSEKMSSYGYNIVNTLITDINPSDDIKNAMNQIIASERLKHAALNIAEAEYIKQVKEAEADCERKRLQGKGIAEQRKAILDGYNDSIKSLSIDLGINSAEILEFVKMTQHLDTIESIGKSNNTKTIFINHDVAGISNSNNESIKLRNMLLQTRE